MIEKTHRRGSTSRCGISTVSSKEHRASNSPQKTKSPARPNQSYIVHQVSQVQSHWTTSTGFSFPLRSNSPHSYVPSAPVTSRNNEMIDFGGRTPRRVQNDGRMNEQIRKVNHSPDTSDRKVALLEARIRELQKQKQDIVFVLNQRINNMQLEIDRLHSELIKDTSIDLKCQNSEEFDHNSISEMLSEQININLELRDQLERVNREAKMIAERGIQWEREKKACFERQKCLQDKVRQLQQSKSSRISAIEALIQEKQKRILQLQEQAYSKSSSKDLKDRQISALEEDLSSEKLDNAQLREEIESLRVRISQLQNQDCKKCKELMHTMFRLNCQLNKK